MKIRRLLDAERGAMLDLLDLWPMVDDWRARDFFARYVDGDPEFRAEDVWVAEEGDALVSCVQIFPRVLQIRGNAVPTGGIGSVFTRPEARGRGVAGSLMRAAMDDMAQRGMELGLLFAGPVPFYEALGWHAWKIRRPLLRRVSSPAGSGLAGSEPFLPDRDLARIMEIHADYSAARDGSCLRDGSFWRTNLEIAGNPQEEFRVVRRSGEVVAYLRAVCLTSFLVLTEWGRVQNAAEELAGLMVSALTPTDADPLAPAGRPSEQFRSLAVATPLLDPGLENALVQRGVETSFADDGLSMFYVARPQALARRFGIAHAPDDEEASLLASVLPEDRFAFWSADRF